jgi:hypothetical protein
MLINQKQVKYFQCSNMLLVLQKGKILSCIYQFWKLLKAMSSLCHQILPLLYFCSEMKEIVGKQPKYPARLNRSNFGRFGHCYCICEKPGQVGCPSRTTLPGANKPKWWQVKGDKDSG